MTFSPPFVADVVTIFILETSYPGFFRKAVCSQFEIYGCKGKRLCTVNFLIIIQGVY